MLQSRISHIYNPANQSAEQLIENFVVRTKEFNKISKNIKETGLHSAPQHYLIEGQRGTGKTSLLLRLQHDMMADDAPTHLLPIQLPEEQYSIFDLCRFWEHVAEYLDDIAGFEKLSELLDSHRHEDDYPAMCYQLIDQQLIKNHKRLVLLLDNFGDMLDRFVDIDQKRLRDIFHTSKHIQLVATSAKTLEHTYRYNKPFYEFFKIIRIKGLNRVESITLLKQLAKVHGHEALIQNIVEKQPQRIETMRRLTGGIPRTIVLLFEIFLDDSAHVFEDLEVILDKVTPFYKHRMDELPTQQQAIMDAIALHWDGITTRAIAEGLKSKRLDTKKIAAQLKELEKHDLVTSKLIDKKNKIYFIAERFFNIWYLMRLGRKKSKVQVEWLIKFLQAWCSPEDLKKRVQAHIRQVRSQEPSLRGSYYMAEALAYMFPYSDLQDELLKTTKDFIGVKDKSLAEQLSVSDKELLKGAKTAFIKQDYSVAVGFLERLRQPYDNHEVIFMIAFCYHLSNDYKNAFRYYEMAARQGNVRAMSNLAFLYMTEQKDIENAIRYYEMAIEQGDYLAMYNLANIYNEREDIDNAIRYYEMAVEEDYENAMTNLAWLYFDNNRDKATALSLSRRAIRTQKNKITLCTWAMITLWNEEFDESYNAISEYFSNSEYQDFVKDTTGYLILLLSKGQHQMALKLFDKFENLKTEFKPVYFALMTLLKDEYPKEYLKMGAELGETVDEILSEVERVGKRL